MFYSGCLYVTVTLVLVRPGQSSSLIDHDRTTVLYVLLLFDIVLGYCSLSIRSHVVKDILTYLPVNAILCRKYVLLDHLEREQSNSQYYYSRCHTFTALSTTSLEITISFSQFPKLQVSPRRFPPTVNQLAACLQMISAGKSAAASFQQGYLVACQVLVVVASNKQSLSESEPVPPVCWEIKRDSVRCTPPPPPLVAITTSSV